MTWIVGIDLREQSHGAVQFAAWIAEHAVAPEAERIIPVHVLEQDHLLAMLRYHHLDEVVAAAREQAGRTLERYGRPEWTNDLRIVQAVRAEERLEEARANARAEAIIIGRAAGRNEQRVVRLGRVARRLLRGVPSPVVVVPPDLLARDIGPGPVVALTSAAEDAHGAFRFATHVARQTGRKLVLAHVVSDPTRAGLPEMPAGSVERARADHLRHGEQELAAWVALAGLQPDSTVVLQGNVIEQAIGFAEAQGSPLLVAGARRRSGIDQVLGHGIGQELAAVAGIPVAVVPASP